MPDTEQQFNIPTDEFSPSDLRDAWQVLTHQDRVQGFRMLPVGTADDFFFSLEAGEQVELLSVFTPGERRTYMRLLPPDDAADVLQTAEPPEFRDELLAQLDDNTRREVIALMAYAEDAAGGLMNPRFARVRADMSIDEALSYLRRQAREKVETVYYAYALDAQQKLLGVVSLRELFQSQPQNKVRDVMSKAEDMITVLDSLDQEAVSHVFQEHDLAAVPVVDADGRMKGIVTVDDIVDVVQEEATEDIQKVGGMEALDASYFETSFLSMIRKRGGWLTVLSLGQMLTITAMGHFADEIEKAVVLSLFLPLIISSGGNSGSQASTLIIRSLALGEMRLADWSRVFRRELASGLVLGGILGVVGLLRVTGWHYFFGAYGAHWSGIGLTVGISLVGIVLWGTLAGALLPFALRRFKLDPASASAPLVATLVDISGVIIYFAVATAILTGTML
ncbi:MAG: magnesium transporter [Myxococcota bacterium]|nr:magnesium transporter [Myxococcota bacterium]